MQKTELILLLTLFAGCKLTSNTLDSQKILNPNTNTDNPSGSQNSSGNTNVNASNDKTPPVIALGSNATNVTISSTTVSFTASDAESGIKQIQCALDSASLTNCTSPVSIKNLVNGAHAFKIVATNNANLATTATQNFNVAIPSADVTPPVIALGSNAANVTTSTTSISFTASDAESGIKQIQCALDSAALANCTSPVSISNLVNGAHAFKIVATNNANLATTATQNFNVAIPSANDTTSPFTTASVANTVTPCIASTGNDYVVGPLSGQLPSLADVPWESLKAGDTVRIQYQSTPYKGHMFISGNGTSLAPIRICGLKGPNGERPIIDGNGAVARRNQNYTSAFMDNIQETRALVLLDRQSNQDFATAAPSYIQIDGLELRGAIPANQFTNSFGNKQNYASFGGCIWIERGNNINILDNVIHDCTNGIFSRSLNYNNATVTKKLRIAGNSIYENGNVNDIGTHNLYVQSLGVVYEFNQIGKVKNGAGGNALKDRSAGSVIRYNKISSGSAHILDLVETEDWSDVAAASGLYRQTFVYGNVISHSGDASVFHYGGDHAGMEASFRKGVLYFYNNTVYAENGWTRIFQLSTTEERAEVWNNVITSAPGVDIWLRSNSDVGDLALYTPGGVTVLGKNFIKSTWGIMASPYHTVGGTVSGESNIITSTSNVIDLVTFKPLSGTSIIDAAAPVPAAIASVIANYPVLYQIDFQGNIKSKSMNGTAYDLGAVEF
jgi:hypothetical protein